eukprot:CAMPEP_0195518466 /NCGR_PEP_ID=MMETSP0794_2-20130614/12952_1 /TAXON_ID=515487 /ORGANISM="Stephanopyxis turris, Strain CCMP 815" /LENGTH=216 /DNA_ID=CAMNT_0040647435 /DNA_START=23 /DNA_END=673 /DNA_ORIENTATION=+
MKFGLRLTAGLLLLLTPFSNGSSIDISLGDKCTSDGTVEATSVYCNDCEFGTDGQVTGSIVNNGLDSEEVCFTVTAYMGVAHKVIYDNVNVNACDAFTPDDDETNCPGSGSYSFDVSFPIPNSQVSDWASSGWSAKVVVEITDCSGSTVGCENVLVSTYSQQEYIMSGSTAAKAGGSLLGVGILVGIGAVFASLLKTRQASGGNNFQRMSDEAVSA